MSEVGCDAERIRARAVHWQFQHMREAEYLAGHLASIVSCEKEKIRSKFGTVDPDALVEKALSRTWDYRDWECTKREWNLIGPGQIINTLEILGDVSNAIDQLLTDRTGKEVRSWDNLDAAEKEEKQHRMKQQLRQRQMHMRI